MSIGYLIGAHGLPGMDEIALHLLDVARNSVEAGARVVSIELIEKAEADCLTLEVTDDGPGIPDVERLRIEAGERPHEGLGGAGLRLLSEAARKSGGNVLIASRPGLGTVVRAFFRYDEPCRLPIGDLEWTLMVLIAADPGVRFKFRHAVGDRAFELDSLDLDRGGNRTTAEALTQLRNRIRHGEASLRPSADHEPAWR